MYRWDDYGNTANEWNVGYGKESLFSDEGYGRYFQDFKGKYKIYISAYAVFERVIKKQNGWSFGDADLVISFSFKLPNDEYAGDKCYVVVKDNTLTPIVLVCGISPQQLRNCIFQAIHYLENK